MTNVVMPAHKEGLLFDEALEAVRLEVDKVLSQAPRLIRTYTEHLCQAKGKFIRTYGVLSCAIDAAGEIHHDAVIFAAAIELLHLATLVHDDVMDNAEVRRGLPTLNSKYGHRTAVICGDYLLAAALTELSGIREEDRDKYKGFAMPNYVERICLGELRQHMNNGNLSLTVMDYLRIINGKTAALFEASFYAGGILCEKEEAKLRGYRKLGYYVGMIFQLMDDCIDFEEDVITTGKNVQSDYEQGVITLPMIYTFENESGLRDKAEKEILSKEELVDSVVKAGGLLFTRSVAKRYYDKAIKTIDRLQLSEDKEKRIRFVLDKAYYGLKTARTKECAGQ